jgi:hypothetical protein
MMRIMKRPLYQVGDIVTMSKRKGKLFKVTGVTDEVWTAAQGKYGYCDPSDVGNPYTSHVILESIFYFDLQPKTKSRRVSLNASTWLIKKVEPQHVIDMTQKLNKFLVETWP